MDINILNTNYDIVGVLDSFTSLIWNVRYSESGDFELKVPVSARDIEWLREDYYIEIPDSDRTMIIERQEPDMDVEKGDVVIFKGRTLESILDRRIVWQQTTVSGNLQNAIKRLLNENVINPSIAARRISNFRFIDSTDPNVTSIRIEETQFTGDDLLDVITTLCLNNDLGFKITLNANKQFEFRLYAGANRTTSQIVYPQVVFSLENDNLFSSKRMQDKSKYKNVTLIAGEGEGLARRTATYGSASDLSRREYFSDARDISSNEGMEDEIPPAEYNKMLIERGKANLKEHIIEKEVEAEVDTSERAMFQYQQDYFIGDVVNVIDRYGVQFSARIKEMTISLTQTGYQSYPIFEYEEAI